MRQFQTHIIRIMTVVLLGLCFSLPISAQNNEKRQLQKAIRSGNLQTIKTTSKQYLKNNEREAVKQIIRLLPRIPELSSYYTLLSTLRTVRSQRSLHVLRETITSRNTSPILRRDLLFALKLNESREVNPLFIDLLKSKNPEIQILAMEEVANRRIKDSMDTLIQLYNEQTRTSNLRHLRALQAMQAMTEQQFTSSRQWQNWWNQHRNKDLPKQTSQSAKAAARTLRGTRKEVHETMVRGQKQKIVVVEGKFDQVEKVLSHLDIPFTKITKQEFRNYSLDNTYALLINCDDYRKRGFPPPAQQKIRQFVADGGYLFTSDWGLKDVIMPAFPNTITWAKSVKNKEIGSGQERVKEKYLQTEKGTVQIWPVKGNAVHPLIKDVFIKTNYNQQPEQRGRYDTGISPNLMDKRLMDFRWHLDDGSQVIKVQSNAVEVLAVSPELARRFDGFGTVACTFFYRDESDRSTTTASINHRKIQTGTAIDDLPNLKGGRVLHVLGHFKKQMQPDDDGYALQKMLMNFLIEARVKHRLNNRE